LALHPTRLQVSSLVLDSQRDYATFRSIGSLTYLTLTPDCAHQVPPEHVVCIEKAFDAAMSSFDAELIALEDEEHEIAKLLEENQKLEGMLR